MQAPIATLNDKKQLVSRSAAVMIVVYPLLFIWQGLDFTDMGYWLTGYQQLFTSPEGVKHQVGACRGSCAIGWLVSEATGNLGVIAFRIALVLSNWLILALVYLLVRRHVPDNARYLLAPVLFVTLTYITKSGSEWIGYNSLTALFFVLTAYALYRGLTVSSLPWMALAGALAALNVFVRLPNVLGLGLLVLVLIWARVNKTKISEPLLQSGAFVAGGLVAVAATLTLISVVGHLGYFMAGFDRIQEMAMDDQSTHSSNALLRLWIRDHVFAFTAGSLVLGYGYLVATFLREANRLTGVAVVCLLALLAVPLFGYANAWKWVVTGTMYLILASGAIYGARHNPPLMLLCVLAGGVLFLAPLGSDNGIRNAVYGSWLAMPVVFVLFAHCAQSEALRVQWRDGALSLTPLKFLGVLLGTALLLFSVTTKFRSTYRDDPNRLRMTHRIDAPLLWGVLTTEGRARLVSQLLTELRTRIRSGDEILAYDGVATVHYLTRTRPYLGTSWPMLNSPITTRERLRQASERSLPGVIVRATHSTYNAGWPDSRQRVSSSEWLRENRRALDEFAVQHGYTVVWANGFFEVLASNGK